MAELIGSLQCEPATIHPGQSVRVDVLDPQGNAYDNQQSFTVTINGIPGSSQYLQFPTAGQRTVRAVATRDGTVEEATATIAVEALPDQPTTQPATGLRLLLARADVGVPMLRAERIDNTSHAVGFAIGTAVPAGHPSAVEATPAVPEFALKKFNGLTVSDTFVHKVTNGKTATLAELSFGKLSDVGGVLERAGIGALRPAYTTYSWDFGDGHKATTREAYTEHDYSGSLGADDLHRQFHVRVTIDPPDADAVEVVRTVTVHNAYALCKARGYIVPPVDADLFPRKMFGSFQANATLHNIESAPITITSRRIEVTSDDPNALTAPGPAETLASPITVPAQSSITIPVSVGFDTVPHDSPGFIAYFGGTSEAGLPVRFEAHFEVPLADRKSSGLKFGDLAVGHLEGLQLALQRVIDKIDPGGPVENPGTIASRVGGRVTNVGRARGGIGGANVGHVGNVANVEGLRVKPIAMRLRGHDKDLVAGKTTQINLLHKIVLGRVAGNITAVDDNEADNLLASLIGSGLLDAGTFHTLSGKTEPPPVEGNECDPDNVPDGFDEEWVCQATSEERTVPTPPRFVNARKGDIILSPGGSGLIGGLLRQVTPAQKYSHSGIMTRNYDQVTHSTASEDRMADYPVGSKPLSGEPAATDGIRPDVMKYGWPGVITQSVEQAVFGESMTDPENGKSYTLKGFGTSAVGMEIGGGLEIVPPLVVKPDPMEETPEVRKQLHLVADAAVADTGKSHYRFFAYTDPTIGQTTTAPAEAGWAAGTYPSVCSSFIWMQLKKLGIHLEGDGPVVMSTDFEPSDVAAGAQAGGVTKDGLYLYTAEERRAAGEWLYNAMYEKAYAKAGWLGRLFTDAPDDVANQMLNTFASDWSDTDAKDSDAWKNTSEASAVSPDNILLWDSPPAKGLYGHAVPLQFRPARVETVTVHRWKKVLTKGTIRGRVTKGGAGVAGAMVQVYDGKTDFTDGNGNYELLAVPFGQYVVKASKDGDDGMYWSGSAACDLEAETLECNVELQPPADVSRLVKIHGHIKTQDYESVGSNEYREEDFYREVVVEPWHSHAGAGYTMGMGGEIRTELQLAVDLQVDRSIVVTHNTLFYEGTSEDTDDLDGSLSGSVKIAKDDFASFTIKVRNDEEDDDDWSHIDLVIENTQNTN